MELHQLRYFLAVAEYRSFSKAALEIDIAQSSLSIQISKLETELGVRLFVRSARSLALTAAGNELLPRAKHIIADIDAIHESMSAFVSAEDGHLTVGAFPGSRYFGFINTISHFKLENAGVRFDIREAECELLQEALAAGRVEAAFFSQARPMPGVTLYHLFADELVMVVKPGHKFEKRGYISIEELADEPLIVNAGSLISNDITNTMQAYRLEPNIVVNTKGTLSSLLGFVASGLGAVLISSMVARYYEAQNLSFLKVRPAIPRDMYLGVLESRESWPVVRKFVEHVLHRHPPLA